MYRKQDYKGAPIILRLFPLRPNKQYDERRKNNWIAGIKKGSSGLRLGGFVPEKPTIKRLHERLSISTIIYMIYSISQVKYSGHHIEKVRSA